MSILLTDGLPEEYDGVPISADFRNMIQVDMILREKSVSEVEKTIAALSQLYPAIPSDISKAVAGLEWFFGRGQGKEADRESAAGQSVKKSFDFEQDANAIYAGFYAAYGISLTTIEFLHWWEFMALFEGLPEDTLLKRIMYWRAVDTNGMPKYEKKHVLKMRQIFALKRADAEPMSIEEIDRQTKNRVARRFEAARRKMEEKEKSK
jgi:hypothetical protein